MAKLPCIPQARIFTLKETGETMSYDQVRQYLMSNPELWSGKGEQKAAPLSSVEATAKALDSIVNKIKSQAGVKLRNLAGLITHNGPEVISKFDPYKIKGQTRGRYGKGFYFSKLFKNFDYGDKSTYLDSSKLNLLNGDVLVSKVLYSLSFPKELDATIYKLEQLLSKSKNIKEYNEISEKVKRLEEKKSSFDKNQIYIQKALEKSIKENPNQDFGSLLESLESKVIEANKLNAAQAVEGLNESLNNLLLESGFDGVSFTEGNEILIVPQEKLNDLIVPSQETFIAEAYHAAKKDGSNPQLVKAVEDLLGEKEGKGEGAAITAKDVVVKKSDDFANDGEYVVFYNDKEIGRLWYDRSQKNWSNPNFYRPSAEPYSYKSIYGDILGETKEEAVSEIIKRHNEAQKEEKPKEPKEPKEPKVSYVKDEILNNFLNILNDIKSLVVNPISKKEFIYDDRAGLEFSRFNKGNRKEIELQDIAVFDKGKGEGMSVMRDITDAADKAGITLTLDAKPFGTGGLGKKDLIEFYKKNGFVVDYEEAYGGEFDNEKDLIDYALENESEGVPMKRIPKEIKTEAKPLSPEQELKQAFNEWKAENNKLGISVDWKRLAETDRKLLKALYGYIQKKIKAAIEAGTKYSFEDFVKEYGKKIVNFEEQKSNWKALYDRAATRKGVSEEKAVESAVKKAAGVKKETKDKVQKFIDKAFAIGSGEGFKEGFTKGATAGGKAGFVTGKEEGFKEGFTKGATQGGKAGFIAGKEVGLEQGTEKGFTKGATEGMRAGAIEGRTQAVDMLRNALENLSGELTPKQISAIVQRLGRLKTFSEAAKQRFIDYADKVIEDANYIAKEKKATEIKKAVNKMSKRPNVAANDQSLYKSFAALSISHLTPRDLDTYMEWGEKIKTKALQPGDRAELAAFIEQAKQRQNAITQERSEKMKEGRMRNLRAEFDEMKEAGTLPEGITTFDEYVESRKPKSKSDPIQDKIRAVQERLSEIPTGENKMIDRLRNVDLSLLSEENLTLIDNSLYNYIDTGELFGIGDPIAAAEYLGRVKAAIEQGLKTRRQVDRKDVEILGMSNLFSTIGETKDSAAKLRALLIQPWLSAATKTNSKYIAIETALMAKADKLKIKQPNWNRIDLFGFLNEGEDNPELFNVLRDQKLSDLETLRDRLAKNVAEKDNSATAKAQKYAYDALKGSIESLGLNESSTLESIREKLSENELAFYNEMRKYLDQYSPKAIENMGLYGNKDVGITKNYWPRTTNKITERPTGVDAFDLYGSEYVGKNMFGREKGRSRLLGKSGYYTPVGQENYFNGLKETMLIAEAADEYHGMQALYNSPDKGYGQLIKGQGARDFKQIMIDYIMDTKNVGRYQGGVANIGADILNSIQKGFTRSLINNPTQVPKQSTALAVPFVEAPKSFFKALGLVLQGMIDGKDSPLAKAINGLFDTTTLGQRLYHPEIIEVKEKYTIDKPAILRNIQQKLKGFNKSIGGDLLTPTDKVISQIATLTGYIEQAERSGKKFNIFDEQANGYDMVAAAAADQMQSKTNNENASIYFSKKQINNRALYYLSNFQANSVRNLYINVRKIVSGRTLQEVDEGLQGVTAYLLATSLFVGAGILTSYGVNVSAFWLYQAIMNNLGDTEDDEEEKERILKYLDSRQLIGLKRKGAGEIISIATGPYGLMARALTEATMAGLEQAYYKTTEEEEKPSDRLFFTPEVVGYAGVVADNILAPIEISDKVNDPKAEAMVQTGLLTAKFLGQSAGNFYTQSLLNAKNLVEKEAKARKEEKNQLQGVANPKQKELAKSKKEWTKSIEQGDAGSARKAFEEVVKLSESKNPYITAIDLRDSFLEDKVKPSVIGSGDEEYIFRSYIFDDKNGNYMIGEKKLKELIPASEKQRYIDEYRREIAKIQKMLAVMNKAVKVKNAYGTDVDWTKSSGWVKQVQDKLQKK